MKNKHILWMGLLLCLPFWSMAQAETEPNDSFTLADAIAEGSLVSGTIGSGGDPNDYFITVPNDDGTLVVAFAYDNLAGAGTADIWAYVYNKAGSQVAVISATNLPLGITRDTLRAYCRAQDTFFVRLNASVPFNYTFSYTTLVSGQRDPEPNDDFVSAVAFMEGDTISGRIGYTSVATDANDYFYSVLPDDGTIRLQVWTDNVSNNTGTDLLYYAYNRGKSLIGSRTLANQALGPSGPDTLMLYCQARDTLYFRFNANGCFAYRFTYELIPPGPNDAEPNDNFGLAQAIAAGDTVDGRIGFTSVSTDANDYFYSVLPDDGTIRLQVWTDNVSNNTGTDLIYYAYNRGRSLIGSRTLANQALGPSGPDTLMLYCRARDTLYFRFNANGCFAYRFTYELIPPGPNDAEPNDNFGLAQAIAAGDTVDGRIGFTSVSTDANDYFYSVLPDDGTIRLQVWTDNVSNNTGTDLLYYAYNRGRSLIGSRTLANQALGPSGPDTLMLYCRARDTLYFRFNANGCFAYRFTYELIPPGPNDAEPNDNFGLAQAIAAGDTVDGRIGFTSVSTDANDYFYSVLPDDGTIRLQVWTDNVSNNTGTDLLYYAYNRGRSLIGSRTLANQALGPSGPDTLMIYCQARDTLYFRFNANGCFAYRFTYELIPSGAADPEPNESFEEAQFFSLDESLKGRVGYGRSGYTDNNDYYRFDNNRKRSLRVFLSLTNSSASTGSDAWLYLYDGGRRLITTKTYANQRPGTLRDTLTLACLPSDSLYLRIQGNACFSYELRFERIEEEPIVSYESIRVGNELAFLPEMTLADRFEWDLGLGGISNERFPIRQYPFGEYKVVLRGIDTTCGFITTHTDSFEFRGIEYFSPTKAGLGGDIIMSLYGAGFDKNVIVRLKKDGTILEPIRAEAVSSVQMRAAFDLHFAEPGFYDVEVIVPGEDPFLFENGFEVESFIYPTCEAEVVGPERIRRSRDINYQLVVRNTGNVMAKGVSVWLLVPDKVEITFERERDFTDYLNTLSYYDSTLNQTFHQPKEGWIDVVDSLTLEYVEIDTFRNLPFKGRAYSLLLPYILAQDVAIVHFKASASEQLAGNFIAYADEINFWGSGATPQWQDGAQVASDIFASTAIDGLNAYGEKTKNVPLQAFAKTAKVGKGHLGLFGQFLGYWSVSGNAGEAFSQAYNAGGALDKANIAAAKTAAECIGDKAVAKMQINSKAAQDQFMSDYRGRARRMMREENPVLQKLDQQQLFKLWDKNTSRQDREALLDLMFQGAKAANKADAMYQNNEKTRAALEKLVEKCPELKPQLEEFIKKKDNWPGNDKEKRKRLNVVNSMDPNAIYGPGGVGPARYFRKQERLTYSIAFENVDTATAPAQIVTVVNRIDTNVFDLRSVKFHNALVGDSTVIFAADRKQFLAFLDMPLRDSIQLRIYAWVDFEESAIKWRFLSIDPKTGDIIADPDGGFLPPNINSPEGEGWVTYSIRLRESVTNGDSLLNQALIYFDDNAPIFTNTWLNVVDEEGPQSSMHPDIKVLRDSIMILRWNASDVGSGVRNVDLYISRNDSDFLLLGTYEGDSVRLIGSPGDTYAFYTVATDSVNIREEKMPAEEARVTLDFDWPGDPFALFPNPSDGQVTLTAGSPQGEATLELIDLSGRRLLRQQRSDWQGNPWVLDLTGLQAGFYTVKIRTDAEEKGAALKLVLRP